MNKIPPSHPTPPEPDSLTSEKESIRKSQEEYLDDQATPSIDKSEYEARRANGGSGGADSQDDQPGREQEGERPTH